MATVTNPGHPGWPPALEDILDRVSRGLPVYWPEMPAMTDQTPYLDYLKREQERTK